MSKLSPPPIIVFVALLLAVVAGCTHQKTNRGHLFRGDWAVEYNRTPWIGTSPDSGDTPYQNVGEETKSRKKFFDCLMKDGNEQQQRQGVRRYCGKNRGCTPQNPCCRTLGCGMWVDPDDPVMPSSHGGTTRACGLTPFCFPEKPCGLTPNCGKPVNVNVNPQTLMMTNPQALNGLGGLAGRNLGIGNALGTTVLPNGAVVNGITANGMAVNGMTANGMATNGMAVSGMTANGMATIRGTSPGRVAAGGAAGSAGVVPGTLVSRGIVPGASAITSGGMVAAIGVATPAGTMTPIGVRLPNGMVNNNIVLRACGMTPNCTAAHPCGLTPACGGAVAVNMVANNAIALASTLQAQGIAGGVMQAGGMGMLVNPITNQPINGLTMSGYPQAGYPPIGYAPMGYAPGYPRYAAGRIDAGAGDELEQETLGEEEEETVVPPGTRSAMPVPRFHPVPSKPAFQRSEGMTPTPESQRTITKPTTTAMTEQRGISEQEIEAALDRAYLEGVSAAMNEVERKLEEKRQVAAKVKLQEKILQQSEYLQKQLDEQERLQTLAMQRAQRERQLRQQAAQQLAAQQLTARQLAPQQTAMLAAADPTLEGTVPLPQRLSQSKQTAMLQEPPKAAAKPSLLQSPMHADMSNNALGNNTHVNPLQLAGSLKSSVTGKVNAALASFRGTEQERVAAKPLPMPQNTAMPKSELTTAQSNFGTPIKPPTMPSVPKYGLLPDKSEQGILQAQFTADDVPLAP